MKLTKNEARKRRKTRIRKKVFGTEQKPRLCVFRSNKHIYVQIIDDLNGTTLVAESTKTMEGDKRLTKDTAFEVGKSAAAKAKEKKIETVVFDRNGFYYHGRVKALADGAREGGLKF